MKLNLYFTVLILITIISSVSEAVIYQPPRDLRPIHEVYEQSRKGGGLSADGPNFNLGFTETASESESEVMGQKLYQSQLVANINCNADDLAFAIPARYKTVKWRVEGVNQTYSGIAQTDGRGFLRLDFKTRGSLMDKTLKVAFEKVNVSIQLGRHSYLVEMDEKDCR